MAGKKKVATAYSLIRYKGKTARILYEKYGDRDLALEALSYQFSAWVDGFKKYKSVRDVINAVIQDVAPTHRLPYYALGQKYFNLVVERKHDKNTVRELLINQSGAGRPGSTVDVSKLVAVFDAIDQAYKA